VEDFLHLKALLPTSCLEQKMLHGVYPSIPTTVVWRVTA
jgi:hypothetical protein